MEFQLVPTDAQSQQMCQPWQASLASFRTADFLGRQDYIDWWILQWLSSQTTVGSEELPLCVEESLHCDRKLMKQYANAIRAAILRRDTFFVRQHYVLPHKEFWNVVEFSTVSVEMFRALVEKTTLPKKLCPFIVASQRQEILEGFVNQHGPTLPLRDAICHQWVDGVSWLLGEGAEITGDCVGMAVRHAGIFDAVTLYNPEAKQEDWEEFVLQCTLRRVPDVAQVEQWFYIHGFKM